MTPRYAMYALCLLTSLAILGCKTPKTDDGDKTPPTETSATTPTEEAPESQPAAKTELPPCEPDNEGCRSERVGQESLGWITADVSVETIKEKLGEPSKKEERILMEATGDHVETWAWKDAGVQLEMTAPDMTAPVNDHIAVTVFPPFDGKTSRGVGIGSTEEEVRAAYKNLIDPGSRPGEMIIAGSVYGGVFFTIEDGKVTTIFIGAGAE